MLLLLLYSHIQICTTLNSVTLPNNSKACQIYAGSGQTTCTSNTLVITTIENAYLICLQSNVDGISSILYQGNTQKPYYIALVADQFIIISLPTTCNITPMTVPFILQLFNYGITISDSKLFIYGGVSNNNKSQLTLYSIDCNGLINGNPQIQQLLSQSITSISVDLVLWDQSKETFTFHQNYPYIRQLQQSKYSFKVNGQIQSECNTKTPGCLSNPNIHYIPSCNCIYLFYGTQSITQLYIDKIVQNQVWIYYLEQQVWQLMQSIQNQIAIENPKSAILTNISSSIIGFYGNNKFTVFDTDELVWYTTNYYNELPLSIDTLLVFNNRSVFINQTSAVYTDIGDSTTVLQNSYGLKQCRNGYKGTDCSEKSCPGQCFSELYFPDICQECNNHGECVDGICKCHNGYSGLDCATETKCLNDCSGIGICVEYFPFAQCRCPETLKSGGEDCSKIFCLNNCSDNGTCNDKGECQCDTYFTGDDCSILSLNFISDG